MEPGSFRWWFENRETGAITIAQFPNRPLWIAFAGLVVDWFIGGMVGRIAGWVATVAIAWWAGEELARGVNPWRRVLGLAGVGWVLVRVLS